MEPSGPQIRPQDQPGRRVHAPRRAVAWAWQVIGDYGQKREDGTVALGYTQAELSTLCGFARRDGRVYAYIRDLGNVVVRRRGEVILDQNRLAEVERSMVIRPLTQRTLEVGERLSEAFGRPAADGTTALEVTTAGGEHRPAHLRDIAADLGINRSSAHRHLRALRSEGHLADVHRSPTQDGDTELVERVALLEELADVQHQIIARLTRQAELYGALGLTIPIAEGCAPDPDDGALRAENPAMRASNGANPTSQSAHLAVQDQIREDENTSSSLIFCEDPAPCAPDSPRDRAPENPRTPPDGTPRDWATEDLAGLCTDLSAVCERLGRPGPSNWAGLVKALGAYNKDRILHAQRRIACDLTGGRNITSPFGLLAAAADAGHASHRIYFRPPRPKPPDRTEPLIDESSQSGDDEAESTVTTLDNGGDADALRELDHLVAASFAGRPRALESIRHDPAALLAARSRAWRTQHPIPGGSP